MDKPLIRQELLFEPTFFTRVSPTILLKSNSDSLPILTICLLDGLWGNSGTVFNYAWKNMDLACMDQHETQPWKAPFLLPISAAVLHDQHPTAQEVSHFHLIFNLNLSTFHFPHLYLTYYTLLRVLLSKCHSLYNHRSA